MSAVETSIIIVNYNTRDLTHRLLKSILNFCEPNKFEIILIDNGSRDGSASFLKSGFPQVRFIENDHNLGYARAANQGAGLAEGLFLWFINSDCYLTSPIYDSLKMVLEKFPEAAAVTPRTIDASGKFFSICRNFPTYANLIFSRGSLLSHFEVFKKHVDRYTLPDFAAVTKVEAIAGTAMLVRRESFLALGGFDERFFMYFEDTDLCLRLSKLGKACYYQPEAVLTHAQWGSSAANSFRRLTSHHISALEYFMKWHPQRYLANLGLLLLLTANLFFQIIYTNVQLLRNNDT